MKQPATLRQVAELAGVSRSAVSRTFTEGASVAAKTRAKVLQAAKQLGYSPNLLARGLTTRRTSLIGLASDNFHNPAFLEIFDLFTRELQQRGFRPLIVNLTSDYTPEKLVEMIRQYSMDAIILASSALGPDYASALQEQNIPVVQAFTRNRGKVSVNTVGIDNRACGGMAAEHLVALGYRSLAFLGGPRSATTTIDRWAGFRKVLRRYPEIEVSVSYAAEYSFGSGRVEMQRLLQEAPAQAYFCGDDVLSFGAMSAIREAGLVIPEDVGILGVNDIEIAGWAGIELTTIRQPIREIIFGAVELVIAALKDPHRAVEQRLYPFKLIERKTLPRLGRMED